DDLPAAGTADDNLEVPAIPAVPQLRKELAGIMRVDRLSRRTKDRGIDPGRERDPQRIVSRDADRPRSRPDESRKIVRVAGDHVLRREMPEQGGFEEADARRHVARRSVLV